MSTGGFSEGQLGRMHDVMAGYVERGEGPGTVALLAALGATDATANIAFNCFYSAACESDAIGVRLSSGHFRGSWQRVYRQYQQYLRECLGILPTA
jgi:hypothetical protein